MSRAAAREPAWRLLAAALWAACAVVACAAKGAAPCPASAGDLPLEALFGRWEARIDGQPGRAELRLERHPDYAGVRGTVRHAGADPAAPAALLAGDVDADGQLALDESADGRTISAVWLGALDPASCGKVFRGTWRAHGDEDGHAFVLTPSESWK